MNLSLNLGIGVSGSAFGPADLENVVQWLVTDGYTVFDRLSIATFPTIDDYIAFPPPYLGDVPDPDLVPDVNHIPTIAGTITQTDAQLLHSEFWSANGSTFDAKSYADLALHVSGNYGVWIRWKNVYECQIAEIVTYESGYLPTFSAALRNLNYFQQFGCGGGIVEIEYDLDGTPEINQDGSVELVQPS